ncbi:MAG: biotin-dependent carboxyltransferase family protein [Acidobacteria bacterium]|nr:biotin-dependent carboxyltransferase family protein [Acidobacteriota bacterium]
MSILIQKSGLLSTIQDLGRTHFRRFGINPNGAMDKSAIRLINILLGNNETEAVLEIHFPAPKFLFEEAAMVALGGADFGAKLDDKPIENWRPYFIEKNQTLNFTDKVFGNRAYLSIKGGFKIEKWLGSASTNLTAEIGGFEGRSLQKNDRLIFNLRFKIQDTRFRIQDLGFKIQDSGFLYKISKNLIPHYSSRPTVRVIVGAEYEQMTALSEQNFLKQDFAISNDSNRMGFRLNGEPLYLIDKIELVSSAVDFGTIQFLPDGQLIILMADHQTSGGYPRLAHVVSTDLPILAQLGANDKVGFEIISLAQAENLLLQNEIELNYLKFGIEEKLREQLSGQVLCLPNERSENLFN